MEAMTLPPTYMYPHESPEDVLNRILEYVGQEDTPQPLGAHETPSSRREGGQHQALTPNTPRDPLAFDASYDTMTRVLSGLRRLDTSADPIASRRPRTDVAPTVIATAPVPRPRYPIRSAEEQTTAVEAIDRKFIDFMQAWDDPSTETRGRYRGTHRRETRVERITARIGASIGVLAAASTIAYAGIEYFTNRG